MNFCYQAYHACAIGKGKQTAKAEFEKRNFKEMSCRDALFHVAKLWEKIFNITRNNGSFLVKVASLP